jgi:hypothetical protein
MMMAMWEEVKPFEFKGAAVRQAALVQDWRNKVELGGTHGSITLHNSKQP